MRRALSALVPIGTVMVCSERWRVRDRAQKERRVGSDRGSDFLLPFQANAGTPAADGMFYLTSC